MATGVSVTEPAVAPASRGALGVWLCAVGALFGVLYWDTFAGLFQRWLEDPNYQHGFLVPLISGALAYRYLKQAGLPKDGQPVLGLMEILAGGVVHLTAMVIAWPPLDFVGLVLVLRGFALALGGAAWARGLTFPIVFLFFMFPLPVTWMSAVAVWLQDIVSWVSTGMLDLFLECYRRGNTIYVARVSKPLVVAEACSGLRQIMAFIALAAVIGHLSRRSLGFRLTLLALSVPVAIAANVGRVILMAVGSRYFGTHWLSGWMHDLPAMVTLPLGLALMLAVTWGLGRLWPPPRAEGVSPTSGTREVSA